MFFLSLFVSLALAESTPKVPCDINELSETCKISKETAVATPPQSTSKNNKQKKNTVSKSTATKTSNPKTMPSKMPASTSAQ